MIAKAADGKVTRAPLASAKPGDQIEWDIAAANAGDSPALKLATVEHLQAGTVYVGGSARGSHAHVEFSLDGGRTWSAAPTVAVKSRRRYDVVKKADPATYTALRFVSDGALAPKATDTYSLRGARQVTAAFVRTALRAWRRWPRRVAIGARDRRRRARAQANGGTSAGTSDHQHRDRDLLRRHATTTTRSRTP